MNDVKGLYVFLGCASTGLVLSTWKLLGIFFIHLQQDLNSSATEVSLVLGLVSAMSYLYGRIYRFAPTLDRVEPLALRSSIVMVIGQGLHNPIFRLLYNASQCSCTRFITEIWCNTFLSHAFTR